MKRVEFLKLLDELLELEPGTLRGNEALDSIPWDSLALIGFLAMADAHFGLVLTAKDVLKCESVADLMKLIGDRISN